MPSVEGDEVPGTLLSVLPHVGSACPGVFVHVVCGKAKGFHVPLRQKISKRAVEVRRRALLSLQPATLTTLTLHPSFIHRTGKSAPSTASLQPPTRQQSSNPWGGGCCYRPGLTSSFPKGRQAPTHRDEKVPLLQTPSCCQRSPHYRLKGELIPGISHRIHTETHTHTPRLKMSLTPSTFLIFFRLERGKHSVEGKLRLRAGIINPADLHYIHSL